MPSLQRGSTILAVVLSALTCFGCGGADLDRAVIAGDARGVLDAIDAGADIELANAHGITPLMAATRAGRANVAALLIQRGARVRTADKRGFTALHYAAQNGMTQTVGLLLDRGAAVNARAGAGGYTPLHLAVIDSRDEAALLLVVRGADVSRRNAQGFTALDIAASRRDHELGRALQDAIAREARDAAPGG